MLTKKTDGNLFRLTLDDGKANVLSTPMLEALRAAIADAKDADAVLLTSGRDKIFSGGLDLNEVVNAKPAAFDAFLDLFHDTFRALFAFERPLIIAARGSAIAGGAILLCCGDLRLSTRDQGLIGVNEVRLGVPFPVSAFEIVHHALAGGARALTLGELFTKEQALRVGFVHELYEPDAFAGAVEEKLKDLAQVSAAAAAAVKKELRKDALGRMDRNRQDAQRAFVAAWTGKEGQARLQKIVANMRK